MDFEPLTGAYQRLLGGVTVAAIILLFSHLMKRSKQERAPPSVTMRGLLWSFGNALTGPVLGVGGMLWAISQVGNPGLVQAVVASATLVSVPFARRLEHRTLRTPFYLGTALSIAGIAGLFLL